MNGAIGVKKKSFRLSFVLVAQRQNIAQWNANESVSFQECCDFL